MYQILGCAALLMFEHGWMRAADCTLWLQAAIINLAKERSDD